MSKEPDPLRPEVLCRHLRASHVEVNEDGIPSGYGPLYNPDGPEAADQIESDTALIGELVEVLGKVERSLSRYKAPKPDYYALIGPIRSALTRARKRTGGA